MATVLIDAPPAVLRIQVDRNANGELLSALVTVFEGDGSRTAVLDGEGAEKAAEALCPPTLIPAHQPGSEGSA